MDPTKVIPKGFHPQRMRTTNGTSYGFKWKHRSSVRPVNYYIIDFGLSTWFRYRGQNIMSTGVYGQDKTVPELSDTVPYNPFKVDIYQLGGVINKLCDVRDFSSLDRVFFLLKNLYADVHGFSRYVETTGHRNDFEGAREATNSIAGVADIRVDRLGDE